MTLSLTNSDYSLQPVSHLQLPVKSEQHSAVQHNVKKRSSTLFGRCCRRCDMGY